MAYTEKTRDARAAARAASLSRRRLRLEEVRANLRDLNELFEASQQLAKVDLWLDSKVADLLAQAERRRAVGLERARAALAGMRSRGMADQEIAEMAGLTFATVRGYEVSGERQSGG